MIIIEFLAITLIAWAMGYGYMVCAPIFQNNNYANLLYLIAILIMANIILMYIISFFNYYQTEWRLIGRPGKPGEQGKPGASGPKTCQRFSKEPSCDVIEL